MPDFIGAIEVPEASSVGAYPLAPDYGSGEAITPEVSVFTFGTGEEKREQRFYLGTGVRRFTLQHSSVTLDELQDLRDLFDDAKGGEGEFTYDAPNQDGTTTAYTCRFENAPLVWEHEATPSAKVSVNLIGVPTSAPTYTLNSTDTRFPGGTLETALLDPVQQLIPLIKITPREPGYDVIYLSDRRCTVGSQLYQARLLDWTGISQALDGEADQASFRFGNADRVMRDLAEDTDLWRAKIEFSVFHVGTGIKLDFWTGEVKSFSAGEQIDFVMQAADSLYELRETYPTRFITRTCWKKFDDGVNCPYTASGSGGDPTSCDKSFDGANGCQSHGMDAFHGGINAKPQGLFNIKDNGSGTWGINRRSISPYSLVSDSIYGQPLQEIYTDSDMPVNCQLAAGREESDFYTALGVIGAGPIGAFGGDNSKHLLDGQPQHVGFNPRFGAGSDPVQDNDPDPDSDQFSLDPHDGTMAAGVAFVQIRRSDPPGVQLSKLTEHTMQVIVTGGLGGWYWTAPTTRAWSTTITNPIWVALNVFLRAKGMQAASAGTQEALVDTASAIAAAAICNDVVAVVVGTGTETQFKFRGVISQPQALKDWLSDILKNCLGYYTNANGKLKFGIRVNSSAVEAFEAGNVILGSIQLAPIQPRFNDVTVSFADSEYDFQNNTVNIYDQVHVERYGRVGNGSNVNLAGTFSKSQAARIATTMLREEIGGITQAEWLKARRVALKTTALALAVEPGMVCSLTHADMPGGYGEFRVTRWSLNPDWSVDIEGSPTADSMYDLTIGPKPADVTASAPPPPRVTDRVPGDVQPIGSDAFLIDSETEDGINVIHELSYSPPGTDSTDIGVFSGVSIWIEDPDGSGKVYFSGDWNYDGDPDGVGSARYGHARLKSPQPVGGATWRILLVSKSPFYTKPLVLSGTGATPSMTSVIGSQSVGGVAPGDVTIGTPVIDYFADPATAEKKVRITVPYTAPDTPDFNSFDGVQTFLLAPSYDSVTPLSLAADTTNYPQGIHQFSGVALDPGQCVFVLPAPRRQELWRFSLYSKNPSVTSTTAATVDVTVDPSTAINVTSFTVGTPVPGTGAQSYVVPYSFVLPTGVLFGDWDRVEIRVKTASMSGTDKSVVAAVIDRGVNLNPGDTFISKMTFTDLPVSDETWTLTALSYDLAGNRYGSAPTATISMPGIQGVAQVTSFSVSVTAVNAGGVPSGKYTATLTPPASTSWLYARIDRIPCNSSFVPTAGARWEEVFTVQKPPGYTSGSITASQGQVWAKPPNIEYWTFRAVSVSIAYLPNEVSPPTSNVTTAANSGIDLTQINLASINTSEFELASGTSIFQQKQISVDKIVVGTTLKVGGGGGKAGQIGIFDGSNNLIGWAGTQGGLYGIWGKKLYGGGSGPGSAVLSVDDTQLAINYSASGNTFQVDSAAGVIIIGTHGQAEFKAGRLSLKSSGGSNPQTIHAPLTSEYYDSSGIKRAEAGSSFGSPFFNTYSSGGSSRFSASDSSVDLSSIPLKIAGTTVIDSSREGWFNSKVSIGGVQVVGSQQSDVGALTLAPDSSILNSLDPTGHLYNICFDSFTKHNQWRTLVRAHGLTN